ncbi:MAG: DUF4124 domain-containing protein [Gammaproteobacteria bacterium]|nr:DUF4124 domain-containing protein [Gammaproteobacteria bacterium]
MPRAIALLLLVLAAPAVAGGIYRWTDAQGQVHFGDRPPAGAGEALPLTSRPTPPAPEPDAGARRARQDRLLRAFETERRERAEQAAAARAETERRERNCRAARERLAGARSAAYLFRRDGSGERVILDDGERAAAEAESEALVARWCD